MTSEIDFVLSSKTNLTEQTIKTYKNNYNKIRAIIEKNISECSEKDLIDVIKDISPSVNSRLTLLNVIIVVRKTFNIGIDKLDKYRDELFLEKEKHTKTNLKEKNNTLPSFETIKEYIKTLGINKDIKRYIVNYLTFYYCLRTKDVNLFITTRKDTKDINVSKNFLIVKKTEVELIINEYKTQKTYQQKRIVVKGKLFLEFCNFLPINTYLLTGSDIPISETSLNNTITRMLYKDDEKHLTEADYIKIYLKEINNKPNNLIEIKKISKNRGTSVETLIEYYNINIK